MKIVVQKVLSASVEVEGNLIAKIDTGLLVFVGLKKGDDEKLFDWFINKIKNLRIFDDENGLMNKSVIDNNFEILLISQFTLYGDATKGNRPSFFEAMSSVDAKNLYEKFVLDFSNSYDKVKKGVFGAHMKISLINDGPVTIVIEKNEN
ncbi:TPA: D-tyrosyl-tRNA(Tyr) deacylase [Candidatus Dependentiae bacterium]|nr:MAG: D-tyrosyl-tRNA(Tyr) deacylase [candidate division TM6 bacterium GW2011_GWE2_31_21]KKP54142.1 MAG: D-tyrosyl-tRNA(Tyr) deacylase [candidate division TM6 bacterium GW2011_GWF2_33_332]HBS47863.1 D-tyrosyl-tRNA(Tyr) deacylase [Candidatus Dependentiae bacterium]HBZ73048.1 D-tyrosyl-tRNA(Tyr) deacylase [Candidatus Dependentiae bacterium]